MTGRVQVGETLTGPAGTATYVVVDEPEVLDQAATLATWFLRCPGQSPAWDCYGLSIIHLRPISGVRPADIRIPGATHEVFLVAFHPDLQPVPDRLETWSILRPLNYVEQLQLPDDQAARDLLKLAAEAVLDGLLWAEPPLSGQVEPWRTVLLRTAAHSRGEPHASGGA